MVFSKTSKLLDTGVGLTKTSPGAEKIHHCVNNYTCHYLIIL